MANYSLVINSQFKPFSFQELLQPALMATQAHQQVEEAYGELATKANVWDKMANETTDPKAHAIYKKYASDLEAQADQLARYGLDPTSRQSLINMRSRYASDIVPIETAYKKREADIRAQQEAMIKDPTHFFNRTAGQVSLDEYMDNQNLDVLSDNYSGALLTQQVGQAAKTLAGTLMKRGNLTALGLPYQYERMIQKGATPEQVLQAMSKDPQALPILTKLVEDTMESSGIRNWSSMNGDWANNDMYKRAEAYAMQGLYNAIGTTEYQAYKDDFSMHDALNARSHARTVAAQQAATAASRRLNPLALRSQQEIDTAQKNIDKWLKAGYFYKDKNGQYKMSEKGRLAMGSLGTYIPGTPTLGGTTRGRYKNDFYDAMVALNGGKSFLDKNGRYVAGFGPGQAGNLFGAYIARNQEGAYDTYHTTEYDRQLDSSYGKQVMSQLLANSSVRGLTPVEFDGKKGWKKGTPLTAADLKGFTATNIRYSKFGDTAILQKDGEDPIRVLLPRGINTSAEAAVKHAIANADEFGAVLSQKYAPMTYEDPETGEMKLRKDLAGNILYTRTPLTNEDKILFEHYRRSALDDMSAYGAQYVVPSITEDEKISYFPY